MKEGMNEGRKEGRKEENIDTDIHITDFLQGMLFIIKYYIYIKKKIHFFFYKIYNELVLIIVTKHLLNIQFVFKRLNCYQVFV